MSGSNMAVTTDSIKTRLRQIFRFCAALYDAIDGQKRYARFGYNASVARLGHRQIVDDAQGGSGTRAAIRQQPSPIIAYPASRPIARSILAGSSDEEIERAALRLKQNSQEDPPQGSQNPYLT